MLETVTDIGEVHDFVRSTYFWDEFFTAHKNSQNGGQILTWEITRTATAQELWGVGGVVDNYKRTHSFTLIGRMSLQDSSATEKTFQALVDAVQDKFVGDFDLNGTILPVDPPNEIQIKSVGHASFAGILVHQAILTFEATERVGV